MPAKRSFLTKRDGVGQEDSVIMKFRCRRLHEDDRVRCRSRSTDMGRRGAIQHDNHGAKLGAERAERVTEETPAGDPIKDPRQWWLLRGMQ